MQNSKVTFESVVRTIFYYLNVVKFNIFFIFDEILRLVGVVPVGEIDGKKFYKLSSLRKYQLQKEEESYEFERQLKIIKGKKEGKFHILRIKEYNFDATKLLYLFLEVLDKVGGIHVETIECGNTNYSSTAKVVVSYISDRVIFPRYNYDDNGNKKSMYFQWDDKEEKPEDDNKSDDQNTDNKEMKDNKDTEND